MLPRRKYTWCILELIFFFFFFQKLLHTLDDFHSLHIYIFSSIGLWCGQALSLHGFYMPIKFFFMMTRSSAFKAAADGLAWTVLLFLYCNRFLFFHVFTFTLTRQGCRGVILKFGSSHKNQCSFGFAIQI